MTRTGGAVVTVTTAFAHGYVFGMKVTMTSAGEANFAAGEYTVVGTVTDTTFQYLEGGANVSNGTAQTFAASNLVGSSGFMDVNDRVAYRAHLVEFDSLGNEYTREVSGRIVVTNAAPFVGTAAAKNVQLAILFGVGVPAANSKVCLYRSLKTANAEPNDEMGLVYSKFLTAAEVARGYIWVTDINPDTQISTKLVINETQQGLFQNNNRPPTAKTCAVWGNSIVLGNTTDLPILNMQLLSVDSTSGGLAAGDVIDIGYYVGTTPSNYAWTAVASGTAWTDAKSFTIFTGGTTSIDVKHTLLSFLDSLAWGSAGNLPFNTNYLGVYTSVPGDWPGSFAIQQYYTTDQEEFGSVTTAQRTVSASRLGTSTRGAFAPKLGEVKDTTAAVVTRTSNVITVTTAGNHNFEFGDYVVIYDSWSTQTQLTLGGTLVEGQITSYTANTITFGNTGSDGSSSSAARTVALKYRPLITGARAKNQIYASKPGQWEAFPLQNTIKVGGSQAHILKMVACNNSLMVFKEDGLYRVSRNGTLGENLSAELVDPNAILWAKDSAVAINGKVMAWLTKGVAIIGEQGVEKYVSSQRIDDKLAPATTRVAEPDLLAYPFSRRAQAFVDEKHNLYELRVCMTSGPSAPYASTVNLIYNTDNDTWVEDDLSVVSEVFYQGKRYIQQGTTFYAQDDKVYAGTNTTQSAFTAGAGTGVSDMYAYTNSGGTIPVGSYVVSDNSLVGIVLTSASGSGTVYAPSGVSGAASWTIYNSLLSTVQYAPITMGEENKLKRHQEVQLMFGVREQLTTNLQTATELVTTTETNVCKLGAVSTSVGVNGFAPMNLRMGVPQQHRVAQQLQLTALIYTAYGPWTILGVGCAAQVLGPKVNR